MLAAFVVATSIAGGAASHQAFAAAESEQPKLVILGLVAKQPDDAKHLDALDALLLREVDALRRYRIVTLNDINALLGFERAKDLAGCDALACAVEIGGALDAPLLLVGRVSCLADELMLSFTLLDARGASVLSRASVSVVNRQSLYQVAVTDAVAELFGLPKRGNVADETRALDRAFGQLTMATQPPGADCLVDGHSFGTTPCKISSLPRGEHKLELRLRHHEVHRELVLIEAGRQTQRSIKLVPLPIEMRFVSTPQGASVAIDGTTAGKTPLTVTLQPGEYAVVFDSPGYESAQQRLRVQATSEREVEAQLEALPAQLEVVSQPAAAEIRINGRPVGRGKVSMPMQPGRHALELEHPGFKNIRRRIQLTPGNTRHLDLQMQPGWSAPELARVQLRRNGAIGLAGTSLALLGIGIWQGMNARVYDRNAEVLRFGEPIFEREVAKGRRAALVADASFLLATLSAAASGVLWYQGVTP